MDYLPSREAELAEWLTNFQDRVSASPTTYGLTVDQVTAYTSLYSTWTAAYQAATQPATRTKAAVTEKDIARDNVVRDTRLLVSQIQTFPGTTDSMRDNLGITIRKTTRTRQDAPDAEPRVAVAGVSGLTFMLNIDDPTSLAKKKKFPGAIGAQVYTFVGEEYPADPALWSYNGLATRYVHEITMPFSLAAGTRVWVTATWINAAGTGPLALPVSANVGYAGTSSAEEQMKMAA